MGQRAQFGRSQSVRAPPNERGSRPSARSRSARPGRSRPKRGRPCDHRAHARVGGRAGDHVGGEQLLVDALHRRVVEQRWRAQTGAVDEAGFVTDDPRVARQRVQLAHDLRVGAAVSGRPEDVVEVRRRPRDEEHEQRPRARAACARGSRRARASGGTIVARWLRYSAGSSTSTSAVSGRPRRDRGHVAAVRLPAPGRGGRASGYRASPRR